MRALAPTLAVLGAAIALGGCGSGGGGGGAGDAADTGEQGVAYDAAFDLCRPGLKATADAYAVAATEEDVTAIVVEQVSGGSPKDEKSARAGCLAALAKAKN